MYCEHCGEKIGTGMSFCPACGTPVEAASASGEKTRILRRDRPQASDDKTVRMAQPAARHGQATPEQPREQEPARRPARAILLLALCAVLVALIVLFATTRCANQPTEGGGEPQAEVASPTDSTDDGDELGEVEVNPEGIRAGGPEDGEEGEGKVDPEGTRAGGPEDGGVSQETLDAWADTARSFMTYYPVNHVRTDAGNDPSQLSIEEWASNCLRYVDPNSILAESLRSDPESVALPLGFADAATFAAATEVVAASETGIDIVVTVEGTQSDWDHTLSYPQEYLVHLNDEGLVVEVLDLS